MTRRILAEEPGLDNGIGSLELLLESPAEANAFGLGVLDSPEQKEAQYEKDTGKIHCEHNCGKSVPRVLGAR